MYEDWVSGRISEYNFNMLSEKYQAEQDQLNEKIQVLRTELDSQKQNESDTERWIEAIRKYTHPTELTAELLNALIEKIVIHETVKDADGKSEQEIEIYYRFIGKIE